MSDKCSHNNHTHFLLWLFVWCLTISSCSSCSDCSGDQARTNFKINSLSKDSLSIMEEISLLKSKNEELRKQNIDLQTQINELRGSVSWLQDNAVTKKKP